MGYELHIRREDDRPITLDEWDAYVEGCDDLRMDGFAETETPDGTLRIEGEGIAVWTGHPDAERVGGWITWFQGVISVNNPDEPMIRRMHLIAVALGARVEGDDGELYGPDGEVLGDATSPAEDAPPRGGILRRLFGGR